jgi:hypothetical protein
MDCVNGNCTLKLVGAIVESAQGMEQLQSSLLVKEALAFTIIIFFLRLFETAQSQLFHLLQSPLSFKYPLAPLFQSLVSKHLQGLVGLLDGS